MSVAITGQLFHRRSIDWTIQEFSSLKGRYYKSPIFMLAGSSWLLRIYPNGVATDSEWIALYLYRRRDSDRSAAVLTVNYEFGIKKKVAEFVDWSWSARLSRQFSSNGSGYGVAKFRRRADVLRHAADETGKITVCCNLWFEDGKDSTSIIHPNPTIRPCEESLSCLESLCADFSALLKDDNRKDVSLVSADRIVKGHSLVLCARSRVLNAMLHCHMVEGRSGRVEMPDVSGDVLERFVRYLYTAQLPVPLDLAFVLQLYEMADRYDVPSLMRTAATFLGENLCPYNACEFLLLSDSHSDRSFKEQVVRYIGEKELYLREEVWLPFCDAHPKLANEVLNRFLKRQ